MPAMRIASCSAASVSKRLMSAKGGDWLRSVIGGSGRPVIGRVAPDDPSRTINWTNGNQRLGAAPARPPAFRTPEGYQQWFNSPEAVAAREAIVSYPIVFASDGSFRAEDVPAGRYQMYLNFYERRQTGSGFDPTAGWLNHEFEIEPMPGGRSNDALDLGTLELKTRRIVGSSQ